MYEFVDTNQAGSKNSLPSEALQIDGEYIENLIDGYRTLYVTGVSFWDRKFRREKLIL